MRKDGDTAASQLDRVRVTVKLPGTFRLELVGPSRCRMDRPCVLVVGRGLSKLKAR